MIIDQHLSKSKGNSDLWLHQELTSSAKWCPSAQFMIHLSATRLHDAIRKHAPVFVPSSFVGLKTRIQLALCYGCTVQPGRASLLSCSRLRRSVVRWTAVLEGVSSFREAKQDEIKATFSFQQLPTNSHSTFRIFENPSTISCRPIPLSTRNP